MKNLNKNKKNIGMTVIEVLIACSIISISIFALMKTAEKGLRLSSYALSKSQASFLLEEGAEAVKSIRDNDWTTISNLNLDTPYYLYFDTNTKKWTMDNNITSIDGIFSRIVTISSVGRNGDDDIVDTGGTLDPGTKKVTVTVSWPLPSNTNTKSISFYVANIFN